MRCHLLLATVASCVLASPALAAETTADLPTATVTTAPTQAAPSEAVLEAARIERLQRAELNARMQVVIDASQKTLAGLQKLIDATPDAATLRDLEGRMAQVKRGTTLDLLRVQAAFARENGRIDQADAIDAEIEAILNPARRMPVPTTPSSRRSADITPAGGAR